MNLPFNPDAFPEYSNFTQIGRGAYGAVYHAIHKKTGLSVAIKMVDKITLLSEQVRNEFEKEITINQQLDFPFLTQFLGQASDQNARYIIMECGDKGTLLDYLKKHGKMRESELQRVFCQILSAIMYLHTDHKIVHRDLKLENVLLDNNDVVRVIDLGLCGKITPETPTLTEQCGSIQYCAPEVLKNKPYSYPVDIWSAGITLYAMACGKLPFADNNNRNLINKICNEEPSYQPNISPQVIDLINKMLTKDPANRITIPQIANHPWLFNCRFSFYLTSDFFDSHDYKVVPTERSLVDNDLINTMRLKGLEDENTIPDLLSGENTNSTLCYKLLKKQKIIKLICSPEEIRKMFNIRKTKQVNKTIKSSSSFHPTTVPEPLHAAVHPPTTVHMNFVQPRAKARTISRSFNFAHQSVPIGPKGKPTTQPFAKPTFMGTATVELPSIH